MSRIESALFDSLDAEGVGPFHDLASHRTVSAAEYVISMLDRLESKRVIQVPLVWHSSLRKGGSHMMRSKAPLRFSRVTVSPYELPTWN